ncbi:MAG TPA: FAD-dependent oxidoreductase [Patescibacteria group bacterium]
MKEKKFEYLIVGAGPAGMFACFELLKKVDGKKIALFDMGSRLEERKASEVMTGFGGAGTYSDGKLHYTPKLSHERTFHLIDPDDYQKILNEVEKIFTDFGVDSEYFPKNEEEVELLVAEAEKNDVELVVRRAQHVGTDKLKEVVAKFQKYLLDKGVTLFDRTEIKDLLVEKNVTMGVVDKKGNKYFGKKVLLVPGRVNATWLQNVGKKHGIKYQYDMVEIGVRVEFPRSIMKKYAEALYEVVLKLRTKTFDDVMRTFCSCPNGLVAMETYPQYICVNGHSLSDHKSLNSNFAFVCEVHLTEPVENSIEYAESIAKLATTIGGGKPILQRLKDLQRGRRSTWSRLNKSIVRPSLKDVTPGDISMALPHRIVVNILEGLEKLDSVMPGINSGSTLLYAPEVKLRSSKVALTPDMETTLPNVYAAGDAAGISGSITGAAATGIMAARGMMK